MFSCSVYLQSWSSVRVCVVRFAFLTTMQCGIKVAAEQFNKLQFNVQALYCTYHRGQSQSFTYPALLLSLLYKLTHNSPTKNCIILPRMLSGGCIGSLIQQLGYVNKQFALQRDDMTKELWRQNWISFDRMWLPLRLIDFHHRHIVEAFTTWNWEESAAIERKWQSNTNNGVS